MRYTKSISNWVIIWRVRGMITSVLDLKSLDRLSIIIGGLDKNKATMLWDMEFGFTKTDSLLIKDLWIKRNHMARDDSSA